MEQSLVDDLNQKLSQIEHKVQAYRHGLICEFRHFHQETLRDVNASTAARVSQTIVQTLHERYPALSGASELEQLLIQDSRSATESQTAVSGAGAGLTPTTVDTDSRSAVDSSRADSISSHQQSPPHAVFGAAVAGRRPHERETEFHGLFTPFFLPLLESPSNNSVPASPTSPVSVAAVSSSHEPANAGFGGGTGEDKGTDMTALADQHNPQSLRMSQGQDIMEGQNQVGDWHAISQPEAQSRSDSGLLSEIQARSQDQPIGQRPSHYRRDTDDTTSTVLSEKSETRVRRSALRRSSSASKPQQPSPRRVRFEVRGGEVLPTASPQPTDFPTPRPASPVSSDKPRGFDELTGEEGSEGRDPDEESLPPRKISSSEALRALSRTPLDENIIWTVVNPESDTSPAPKDRSPSPSRFDLSTTRRPATPTTVEAVEAQKRLAAISVDSAEPLEDSGSSSDEEFLSMGTSQSHQPKQHLGSRAARPLSTEKSQSELSSPDPGISQLSGAQKSVTEDKDQTSSDDFDVEEDGMFHFETGGLSAPPRPKKPQPTVDEEVLEASPPLSPARRQSSLQNSYATSPGVPITRPATQSGSSTPTTAKFQVGSLGSYKGRPVVMPVVKNPELHAQAESLGDFNTFVGGLDGRSGIDDGDLSSFRASLVQSGFSGTPRSLTERLMMEDQMEGNSPH